MDEVYYYTVNLPDDNMQAINVSTIEPLREITRQQQWRKYAEAIVQGKSSLPGSNDDFGTHWIESGEYIREQINDDVLLCTFLRCVLPPYDGGRITLYRGENQERWLLGKVGVNWTASIKTAQEFARTWNSVSGGVVLQGDFLPSAVITVPNDESKRQQEQQFTVDPTLAESIKVIQSYEQSEIFAGSKDA